MLVEVKHNREKRQHRVTNLISFSRTCHIARKIEGHEECINIKADSRDLLIERS